MRVLAPFLLVCLCRCAQFPVLATPTYAHCVGGSVLAAQHSEPFMEARQLTFARGPCFWEVRADGAWSITPAS
jgi:hypothetical protein